MFTTQYTQNDGGRAVAMAMLPPPPTKPITLDVPIFLKLKLLTTSESFSGVSGTNTLIGT